MKLSKNSRVLIATFSPWINGIRLPINGNLEPMRDFFSKKVSTTILIDQVYPGSDYVLPKIEIYKGNRVTKINKMPWYINILSPLLKLSNKPGTHIVFKIRDFLSVIYCGFLFKKNYNFFIGFESINAIGGIVLRKFGKVEKVIYYVSDYSPNRYQNKIFNNLYLFIDRVAVKNSDVVWDVSPAILPARIKSGLNANKTKHVLVVPNALYPSQIKSLKIDNLEKHSLVFMGTTGIENGPDLAIKALSLVVKKYKTAHLHIIGSGREKELAKLVNKYGLIKNVEFHGFIPNREKVSELTRKFMIGLAPYINLKGSARLYGDATKIRAYLAAGLPVITTNVPPLGREIEKIGGGLIVKDNERELAAGIIKLFENKKLYKAMRENAFRFAKNNTWDNEFNKAFKKMEKI